MSLNVGNILLILTYPKTPATSKYYKANIYVYYKSQWQFFTTNLKKKEKENDSIVTMMLGKDHKYRLGEEEKAW